MARPSDRFLQVVHYASPTGRDAWGKPTMGDPIPGRARVQPTRKLIRDMAGNEHLATAVIYTDAPIEPSIHRVWLPGTDTTDFNQARRVAAVDILVGGDGLETYRKVWL